MDHKILINIEGNIGVGKTTFSNIIKEAIPDSFVVEEPIDIWLNTKDNNNENVNKNFVNITGISIYDEPPKTEQSEQSEPEPE